MLWKVSRNKIVSHFYKCSCFSEHKAIKPWEYVTQNTPLCLSKVSTEISCHIMLKQTALIFSSWKVSYQFEWVRSSKTLKFRVLKHKRETVHSNTMSTISSCLVSCLVISTQHREHSWHMSWAMVQTLCT